jgi:NADH-quinone oxidoreductase subunit F
MPVMRLVTENIDVPGMDTLDGYRGVGGYETLKGVLKDKVDPAKITEEVKTSGLRGRGGAGFPTGTKWSFIPKDADTVYLVNNADESEPGTFKDKLLIDKLPHRIIEGMLLAAYALRCRTSFIYIRGEFAEGARTLERVLDEARRAKLLGRNILGSGWDHDILLFRGAGAYICGEETGLLESLEGKRGYPRIKPPFPAIKGIYGKPTVVNNVETLAAVPWIVKNGGAAHAAIGRPKSAGTKMFSVCGDVVRPGVHEVVMGTPARELIYDLCGGIAGGETLKACIPGGSSVPVLTKEETEGMDLDYESIQAAGSLLGSGGMIVFGDGACMVEALSVLLEFYADESCGQCTPCREGSGWTNRIVHKILHGEGRPEHLDTLLDLSKNMAGRTICALADAIAMPIDSFLQRFRGEFEQHIAEKRCARAEAVGAHA